MNIFNYIYKYYKKLTNVGKIMIWITLFLIAISLFGKNAKEGYENEKKIMLFKENNDIYDDFYANIYDELVYNELKDDFQIGEIINKTNPTNKSVILDIGSGTGHNVDKLKKLGFNNTIGVDKSLSMVNKAKDNYPSCNFIKGDIINPSLFQYNSFTHILCLYFTIYYIPNKYQFFENCFIWLMSGGHLVVHLVEPKQFDPILPPSNPLFLLSPQRYAPKRITNSKVVFNDFTYQSDFKLDEENNTALFIEKFENKKNNTKFRRNEHKFYMESIDTILQIAQEIGFIVVSKIDMISVSYEYQYIYVFQKP